MYMVSLCQSTCVCVCVRACVRACVCACVWLYIELDSHWCSLWLFQVPPFHPKLCPLYCRESDILSPPVAASVAPLTNTSSNEVAEGWNNDSYSGETADSCNRSGETEDEVELMYDPTLECFYDPKTCKYYVLQ